MSSPYRVFANAIVCVCVFSLLSLTLTSCSRAPLPIIQGRVHGGQQPVSGSTIQLWAVADSGDPASSTPLLTQSVTTDATGSFTLTGLYTCPSPSTLVYISATGGNPGLGGSINNPAIAEYAALGLCTNLSTVTAIDISEITSVALAAAYASFNSQPHGPSSTYSDMVTAFNLANSLANNSTGQAIGPYLPPGNTVPVAKLDTLANIIASCINTAGGTAGDGSPCGILFDNAGGAATTDTMSALIQIESNTTQNVNNLFNLASPVGPFQPSLSSAPSDWSLALTPTP
jgi:hypothetical protein